MRVRELRSETWLPAPREQVFEFFGDAGNLERITPPWLQFEIDTPLPIVMGPGALIDYRLRVRGLPVRWRTEITRWEPPFFFVDECRRGPYREWIHRHTFEERDGGTVVRDEVSYAVPGWFLEPLIHRFLVGPDLVRVFVFRQDTIEAIFSRDGDLSSGVHIPDPEGATTER